MRQVTRHRSRTRVQRVCSYELPNTGVVESVLGVFTRRNYYLLIPDLTGELRSRVSEQRPVSLAIHPNATLGKLQMDGDRLEMQACKPGVARCQQLS